MTAATRTEMQRLLAHEFERRGWSYDLVTVPTILDEVQRVHVVEPERLAETVSAEYLERVGATRVDIAGAIKDAIGDRELVAETTTTMIVNDHRYSINFGTGAQVTGSSLNTGAPISVQGGSPKEEILDALATLVTAGLGGEWNTEAADGLAQVIAGRGDISSRDIQDRALAAAEAAGTDRGRARELITQVASGTVSGVLAPWIIAALGQVT